MKDERDLEEVERALSVLGGRHPEAVRAARQAAQAAAVRKEEHERLAAVERVRSVRRRVVMVVVAVVAGACALGAWRFFAKRAVADAEVAPLVARYVALGFDELPRSSLAPEDRVQATTVAGDCYVAVAARSATLHVARPIASGDANGDALFCTCASESLTVTAGGAPVRLLRVAGSALGGTRAAVYRITGRAPPVLAGDDACSDDALAAFARDARYGTQERDGAWLGAHAALDDAGFTTVASAPARLPFVFVPAARDATCFVADAGGVKLTLWTLDNGVQKPVRDARSIAWCAAKPATFVVERAGGGPGSSAVVVSAPSRRIGGLVGLRELASRGGLASVFWIRDDERGDIAADTLRASVVPDPVAVGSQTLEASQTKDARVLVFSTQGGADTFASNEADFRCSPPLEARDALCVQAHALTWHEPAPRADGSHVPCGAAYGPLPYWMSAVAESRDAQAIDAELELVGFARRMAQRGFLPGVIEGVTEHEDSVEVLGRSGDDAVVAVGLWPAPPFIHPYGGDGQRPWTLDGEPHVEPLAGGVRVKLPVRERAAIPLEKRRTVVFRHSTK